MSIIKIYNVYRGYENAYDKIGAGNYYHNLFGALVLADINKKKKHYRLFFLDRILYIVDTLDDTFLPEELQHIAKHKNYSKFYRIPNYPSHITKSKEERDILTKKGQFENYIYHPFYFTLDLSKDTVDKYIIESKFFKLNRDTQYDNISDIITTIMLRAQEELKKYLYAIKNNDTQITFEELFDRMIQQYSDPYNDIHYRKIPDKNGIILLSRLDNIYKSYHLDNIVLTMIYINTISRMMIRAPESYKIFRYMNDRSCVSAYKYIKKNVNENSIWYNLKKSLKDLEIFDLKLDRWCKWLHNIVKDNESISKYGRKSYHRSHLDSVMNGMSFDDVINNITSNTIDNISNERYNNERYCMLNNNSTSHFVGQSIYNIVYMSHILNKKIATLLKDCGKYNGPIYMCPIPKITKDASTFNNNHKINKTNQVLYVMGLHQIAMKEAIKNYMFKVDEDNKNKKHQVSYAQQLLYTSIDPRSAMINDIFKGTHMYYYHNLSLERYVTSYMRLGILGNSIFSGKIQSHHLSTEIAKRSQYLGPIWLRPLYNNEYFNINCMISHKIAIKGYSNNTRFAPSICDWSPTNNHINMYTSYANRYYYYEYNGLSRPIIYDTTLVGNFSNIAVELKESFYRSTLQNNQLYKTNYFGIWYTTLSSMMQMRLYMLGIIMMALEHDDDCIVSAPSQKYKKMLMSKYYTYQSLSPWRYSYDIAKQRKINISPLIYLPNKYISDDIIDNVKDNVMLCYNENNTNLNVIRKQLRDSLTNRAIFNKKVKSHVDVSNILVELYNINYFYDSLKLNESMIDIIGQIATEDLHSYVQFWGA